MSRTDGGKSIFPITETRETNLTAQSHYTEIGTAVVIYCEHICLNDS